MAINADYRYFEPVRLPMWSRTGPRAVAGLLIAVVLCFGSGTARAGNISLSLTGSLNFLDASPDLVPVLGPEQVTLKVKTVGRRGIPWSLTLVADDDFRSGSQVIPISVVSWTVFPNPPYMDGTLSTVQPRLIAVGQTHDLDLVTFDFYMQNSWSYNVGSYTATATFTLAAP